MFHSIHSGLQFLLKMGSGVWTRCYLVPVSILTFSNLWLEYVWVYTFFWERKIEDNIPWTLLSPYVCAFLMQLRAPPLPYAPHTLSALLSFIAHHSSAQHMFLRAWDALTQTSWSLTPCPVLLAASWGILNPAASPTLARLCRRGNVRLDF